MKELSPRPPGRPDRPVLRGWRERVWYLILQARGPVVPVATAAMSRGLRLLNRVSPPWFLKMLGRPQWLFEAQVPIPHRALTLTEPLEPSSDALELCERIGAAYRLAHDSYRDLSVIWDDKVAQHHSALHTALMADDPAAVNEQLRWMFRRPFLRGISTPIDYEEPAARWFWSLMTYDSLVSLAEAVGAIRAENPEQGIVGRAFVEGIDAVPRRVEDVLGVSLDYPRVGAPYGITIGERLIIRETGRHLHAAVRLHQVVENDLDRAVPGGARVLEIGAGFGGVAMWYLRLLKDGPGSYTIVDLPLMNTFQAYFLGMVYGIDDVSLYGEPASAARIRIGPPALIADNDVVADVVFNQDSIPEMTESAARNYLSWMNDNVTGVFVSCNQEMGPFYGVTQLVVNEVASGYENLKRISRQPAWTRRGYVEEVYRCGGGGPTR